MRICGLTRALRHLGKPRFGPAVEEEADFPDANLVAVRETAGGPRHGGCRPTCRSCSGEVLDFGPLAGDDEARMFA